MEYVRNLQNNAYILGDEEGAFREAGISFRIVLFSKTVHTSEDFEDLRQVAVKQGTNRETCPAVMLFIALVHYPAERTFSLPSLYKLFLPLNGTLSFRT